MASLFSRTIALPQDHGTWAFFLSPLAVGWGVGLTGGGELRFEAVLLTAVMLAGFLLRQPLSLAVKIGAGRFPRERRNPVIVWTLFYAAVAVAGLGVLFGRGYTLLGWFALPAVPIFAYHLVLVRKRQERHRIGVQLLATGVLALAAPAICGVLRGTLSLEGGVLWILCWLQSAGSVVFVYYRLGELRAEKGGEAGGGARFSSLGRLRNRALLYTSFNPVFVALLVAAGVVSRGIPLPFLLQWGETLRAIRLSEKGGVSRDNAVAIGIRQMGVATLFTVLFIWLW